MTDTTAPTADEQRTAGDTNTETPADNDQDTTAETSDPADAGDDQDNEDSPEDSKLLAESKKYRKRAQEAEASLADLEDRYRTVITSVAENQVQQRGLAPNALWAAGTKLEDLLDDDGRVDTSKIDAAAHAARRYLGITTAESPNQGRGAASSVRESWSSVFNSGRE